MRKLNSEETWKGVLLIIRLRKIYHPICYTKNWKLKHSFIALVMFNLFLIGVFTRLTSPGPYWAKSCWGKGINSGSHTHNIFTTQGHGGSPNEGSAQWRGHLRTWKTMHTIHAAIHSNMTNLKGWLWRPNYIQEPCGTKASWHLSTPWQACMLPPAPQRWTKVNTYDKNYIAGCIVAYVCETCSLSSKGEQRLSVFENKVHRKIFESKRDKITREWRKLHNFELHALILFT